MAIADGSGLPVAIWIGGARPHEARPAIDLPCHPCLGPRREKPPLRRVGVFEAPPTGLEPVT